MPRGMEFSAALPRHALHPKTSAVPVFSGILHARDAVSLRATASTMRHHANKASTPKRQLAKVYLPLHTDHKGPGPTIRI